MTKRQRRDTRKRTLKFLDNIPEAYPGTRAILCKGIDSTLIMAENLLKVHKP